MTTSKYIYVKKGLESKGEFVERSEWNEEFTSDDDWYVSTYYYEQDALDYFKINGRIKGFKNVKTDKLWFDFDALDLSKAKSDVYTVINRLKEKGIKESAIDIYFSGSKGFTVEVHVDKMLNRVQVEHLTCNVFGKDLETFDSTMYDENQIFRVPNTKHPKSGLYKVQLTLNQLNLSIEKIKEYAKTTRPIKIREHGKLIPELLEIKTTKQPIDKKTEELNFDISRRPPHWKDYKWALLNAYQVKDNERHTALLVIAATCKGLGYDESLTRFMCQSFDEKFCAKTGKPPVEDLDDNIIPSIFTDDWNGGQYSHKSNKWLQEYCTRIGVDVNTASDDLTIKIEDAVKLFKDYATNIDKLTITTGIPPLDKNLRMTIGMVVGIVAAPGVGKCLGKDTPILMYDGSVKPVQDIVPGDLLMGDDSTPRTVLSTVKGQDTLFKVKQKNGNDYIVNSAHILSLKGSSTNKQQYSHDKIWDIEITDYLKSTKDFKKRVKGYKVPVSFTKKYQSIDPYFIGYWLGNGTSSKTELTVHKEHIPVFQFLERFSMQENVGFKTRENSDNSLSISLTTYRGSKENQLLEKMRTLNLMNNKHIPNDYLLGDTEQRNSLLAGLIDSDGYCDKRGNYEIIQKSKELANQIVFLCRSLGYKTSINECTKGYKNFTGIYYRINIASDDFSRIPVLLEYKKLEKIERQRYYDLTEIEIEEVGVGDYYGFELDGNKRFLLGDFTVTHNTSISLQILNSMSQKGEQSIFFSYDMYHALVIQKLIQKHFKDQPDYIFEKFKQGDKEYEQQVHDKLKEEYRNVEFCFDTGQTPDDIERTIRKTKDETGKDVRLIVIDYNELVLSDLSDSTQSSAYVIQKLRKIASQYNCCVVVLLQPNKMSGSPADELVSYRSAKGSSAIEQAISVMLGISRPGYNPRKPENDQFMVINCLKNRMGRLFNVELGWDGLTGTVEELTHEKKQLLKQLEEEKILEKEGKSDDGW